MHGLIAVSFRRAVTALAVCWPCLAITDSLYAPQTGRGMSMLYLAFHVECIIDGEGKTFDFPARWQTSPLPQPSLLNSCKLSRDKVDGDRLRPRSQGQSVHFLETEKICRPPLYDLSVFYLTLIL